MSDISQRIRNVERFNVILSTLSKYGLADWVRDWSPEFIKQHFKSGAGESLREMPWEQRVRLAFTELGTTFIKLGQVLSTRADLVGTEVATELEKLQADTPADPPESVRATIEAELGKPPEQLFAEFDDVALGSASIGQVHLARLPSGEPVVVKVQHTGIEDVVVKDLEILGTIAGLIEKHSPVLRPYRPRALVAEFRRNLLRELDFHRERRNLEEFARNFQDDPTVHFPVAYRELSSQRVLTMERLDGTPIANTAALEETKVDTATFAWNAATVFVEMIFRDGFYHADPHPGNIMVLSGDVVGLLDCGMAGRIDPEMREQLETFIQAGVDKDTQEMTTRVIELGTPAGELDRDQLQEDVSDFVSDYGARSIEEFDVTSALNEIVAIVRRHRIVLRPSISLLIRMLVMFEGSSRLVSRDFSLMELLKPYLEKRMLHRLSPQRLLSRLQRSYRDWARLLDNLPRDLNEILARVQKGTFDVNLEHRRLDTIVNRLVYGVLTAALLVGSAMLWSRQAPPTIAGVSVIGAAGVALAGFLGFRLLRAIKREGGLER